jgi:hypothetical protein
MTGLRREERIPVQLPVRIWGMDANKKPFIQSASTADVTRSGARIIGMATATMQGEIIGIQHGDVKSRCKIAWTGTEGTPRAGQIGIRMLEMDKFLWGDAMQAAKDALRKKTVVPGAAPPPAAGRRLYARHACNGKIELKRDGSNHPLWGVLNDISLTGCYVETIDPFPKGVHATMIITVAGHEIHAKGEVRVVHPMVGMGLAFNDLTLADRGRIQEVVDELSGKKKDDVDPAPIISADAPGPQRPEISQVLDKVNETLQRLETQLAQPGKRMDARVDLALRDGIRHLRVTVNTAQQCLDLEQQGIDQFETLSQISAERLRMASKIATDLVNDLDACEVTIDTPGLDKLYLDLVKLQGRLAMIFKPLERSHTA